MKYTDLINDNYYVATKRGTVWYLKINRREAKDVYTDIGICGDSLYGPKNAHWSSGADTFEYREATDREILWMETCSKEKRVSPFENIIIQHYEIY